LAIAISISAAISCADTVILAVAVTELAAISASVNAAICRTNNNAPADFAAQRTAFCATNVASVAVSVATAELSAVGAAIDGLDASDSRAHAGADDGSHAAPDTRTAGRAPPAGTETAASAAYDDSRNG
jgi:hypothetical protein